MLIAKVITVSEEFSTLRNAFVFFRFNKCLIMVFHLVMIDFLAPYEG